MKNKNLILAIVIAIIAALLLFIYFSGKEKEVISKGNLNKVIVAKKYIEKGATISSKLVKEAEVPEIYIQPGAIRKAENAVDKIALVSMSEGEQILANKITKTADCLSSVVPIGFRAVTILVDSESGLNDMLKQGDFVDVIGTFDESSSKGSYTATVLQNVKVLAVNDSFNQNITEKSQTLTKESFGPSTVTLALEPSEAEVLSFAETKGKLRLCLRNPGDDKNISTKITNFNNLLRSQQAV